MFARLLCPPRVGSRAARPLTLFGRKPTPSSAAPDTAATPGSAATSETLVDMFETSVARFGPRPLFGTYRVLPEPGYDWDTWSYATTGRQVDLTRRMLAEMGVRKGDVVAVIAHNRPEWAVGAMATLGLGAAYTPMYESQKMAQWEYVLRETAARVVFASTRAVAEQLAALPNPPFAHIVCLEGGGESFGPSYAHRLAHVNSGPDASGAHADASVRRGDLASLIYTSGTTGNPKGVMLSHGNILSNIAGSAQLIAGRYGADDVHLSFLPWAHTYGQTVELFGGINVGAALGIARTSQTILEDMKLVRPTVLVAVPQLFYRVYDGVLHRVAKESPLRRRLFQLALDVARHRREQLDAHAHSSPIVNFEYYASDKLILSKVKAAFGGRLRFCLTGGASLSPDIQHFFTDMGIPLLEGYGLTETAPVVVSERWGVTEAQQGGLQELPGVKVHILGADQKPLPPNCEGEIGVVGPNVMLGYYKNEAATKEAFTDVDGQRCFRTGDLGVMSPAGVLRITGRIKEQYKLINGKFVVPGPVENVLMRSPYIMQAFVYGLDRPHNVALIVPDAVALAAHFDWHGKPTDLLREKKAEVHAFLMAEIDKYQDASAALKSYEKVEAIAVLDAPFTVENELLTPKLSMKRPAITRLYQAALDDLYKK